MECIWKSKEDKWNKEAGFYQKIDYCKKAREQCQGGEEICSKFEAGEPPKEKKGKKGQEQDEQGEGEKEESGIEEPENPAE